jgi:hypothetical protein
MTDHSQAIHRWGYFLSFLKADQRVKNRTLKFLLLFLSPSSGNASERE